MKRVAIVALLLVLSLLTSSCGIGQSKAYEPDNVYDFDGVKVYFGEETSVEENAKWAETINNAFELLPEVIIDEFRAENNAHYKKDVYDIEIKRVQYKSDSEHSKEETDTRARFSHSADFRPLGASRLTIYQKPMSDYSKNEQLRFFLTAIGYEYEHPRVQAVFNYAVNSMEPREFSENEGEHLDYALSFADYFLDPKGLKKNYPIRFGALDEWFDAKIHNNQTAQVVVFLFFGLTPHLLLIGSFAPGSNIHD